MEQRKVVHENINLRIVKDETGNWISQSFADDGNMKGSWNDWVSFAKKILEEEGWNKKYCRNT